MKKLTNDHRTRVTKMLIRKGFTSLLRQKPIQSISIKELCSAAGISRGTFYAHYDDIYDLLKQIENEMMADLEKAMEPMINMDSQSVTPVEITTGIFKWLKDNYDMCIVTLGEYGDRSFALKLLNIGREKCLDSYMKYFKDVSPRDIEWFYAYASGGCIGILQKWLDEGMASPAEDVAKMTENMIMRGVGSLGEKRQ